jgi:hypothetical protein
MHSRQELLKAIEKKHTVIGILKMQAIGMSFF